MEPRLPKKGSEGELMNLRGCDVGQIHLACSTARSKLVDSFFVMACATCFVFCDRVEIVADNTLLVSGL